MEKDNDERLHRIACDLVDEVRGKKPCQKKVEDMEDDERFKEMLKKFLPEVLNELTGETDFGRAFYSLYKEKM